MFFGGTKCLSEVGVAGPLKFSKIPLSDHFVHLLFAFSKLNNTYNYIASINFNCKVLEIFNFNTKNPSPPTFFEIIA